MGYLGRSSPSTLEVRPLRADIPRNTALVAVGAFCLSPSYITFYGSKIQSNIMLSAFQMGSHAFFKYILTNYELITTYHWFNIR